VRDYVDMCYGYRFCLCSYLLHWLSFFLWPLYYLSFLWLLHSLSFDLRILIISMVSCNVSSVNKACCTLSKELLVSSTNVYATVLRVSILPLFIRFFISIFLTCNLHSWKIHRHIVPHSTLTVDQAHPNLRAATMCDLISVAYMLVEDTSISFDNVQHAIA
jgi:hypothetical protein